jgi:glucose-6-phosphate 1-dehydrogenase
MLASDYLARHPTQRMAMEGCVYLHRAGKCLSFTRTKVFDRFRKPPSVIKESGLSPNHLRLRISLDTCNRNRHDGHGPKRADDGPNRGDASKPPASAEEMEAYERVLGDAIAGDSTRFATT